jgi:thiamine-phosphate pyrophosphorylase
LSARGLGVLEFLTGLVDGGARMVQFRHKASATKEVFALLEEVARRCRDARVELIINDRADIAAIFGVGLHLGQDDLQPAMARRVLGNWPTVGFSTHNAEQLRAADSEPADYLAVGPVFATGSKEKPDPVLGVEALAGLRTLTAKPLVAIGGITRERAPEVLAAGADSVAVIADLLPEPLTTENVRRRMEEWLNRTR